MISKYCGLMQKIRKVKRIFFLNYELIFLIKVMKFYNLKSMDLSLNWIEAVDKHYILGGDETEYNWPSFDSGNDSCNTNNSIPINSNLNELELPPSMLFAKSILEDFRDPLGLNDSLYRY